MANSMSIKIEVIELKPNDEHGCIVLCHYQGQMFDMRIEKYTERIKQVAKERGISYGVLCDEINTTLRDRRKS